MDEKSSVGGSYLGDAASAGADVVGNNSDDSAVFGNAGNIGNPTDVGYPLPPQRNSGLLPGMTESLAENQQLLSAKDDVPSEMQEGHHHTDTTLLVAETQYNKLGHVVRREKVDIKPKSSSQFVPDDVAAQDDVFAPADSTALGEHDTHAFLLLSVG